MSRVWRVLKFTEPCSLTIAAPLCCLGSQTRNTAPSRSAKTAILPASPVSKGSARMAPPAARTRSAASSARSTQYVGPPGGRVAGVFGLGHGGHIAAADPADEVRAGAGRQHVLELPAEQLAVELGRGAGVGLARVRPAGHAGDVSVSLGHLRSSSLCRWWWTRRHAMAYLGQYRSSTFVNIKRL